MTNPRGAQSDECLQLRRWLNEYYEMEGDVWAQLLTHERLSRDHHGT